MQQRRHYTDSLLDAYILVLQFKSSLLLSEHFVSTGNVQLRLTVGLHKTQNDNIGLNLACILYIALAMVA